MIRWPVMSGRVMRRRSRMGRGCRTDHFCTIVSSYGPAAVSRTAILSVSVYSPLAAIDVTVPETSGGTMMRCFTSGVSRTSAMPWPAVTLSPGLTSGSNGHRFFVSSGSTFSPRLIHAPLWAWMLGSGRWMPS